MRKVVAAEYVTLEGVITDPGGIGQIERGGWSDAPFNAKSLRNSSSSNSPRAMPCSSGA
jgi:hypothetical protein